MPIHVALMKLTWHGKISAIALAAATLDYLVTS